VFEIGTSLYDARQRRQLTYVDLEQVTKIRAKYLRALEEEDFATLPAPTYVRGFLRNYAEALGLDGQLYVDEYDSRFVGREEETVLRPRRSAPVPRGGRWLERNAVLVVLAAIVLITAIIVGAWRFVPESHHPAVVQTAPRLAPATRLVLHARRSTWLEVHVASPAGRLLFQGTLERGESQRFAAGRLWLNVGSPAKLTATLNGRAIALPGRLAPQLLVATANGVAPLKYG
jgi:hypothetical protein